MKFTNSNFDLFPKATYFIADIAANHDGSLDRAKALIKLAAESGANAAKFQNFRAETIVSSKGFQELGKKLTHQSKWTKDVVEVYKEAELPLEWTEELISTCVEFGIDYFTAPYDLDYIDYFRTKMPVFKIGSGDITYLESLNKIAATGLPVLLATGASSLEDVKLAVEILSQNSSQIVIMQCNTNYTGSEDNFKYLNLEVISQYKEIFPTCGLGLSDHTPGHISVLGAVTLGARFIEKHFTDDKSRPGPDHGFSLDPHDWKSMVGNTRILEKSLGDGSKKVEDNELEAQIVQRRALRFVSDLPRGHVISQGDLIALRPIPETGISPMDASLVLGKKIREQVKADELITFDKIDD
ncbi:N-acetylneuraminate synthase family protein [Candidatus Planktophila versatilis]|uniref:N-acetylneuraminate synthase family protein n=1 Tax=Candidatus Planktophila versatilis TaxID=1884905 RepID=UPI000BAC668F|nr:N-acetylneuraminate synthase family protein [Candidatus Planktophila versatilis]